MLYPLCDICYYYVMGIIGYDMCWEDNINDNDNDV